MDLEMIQLDFKMSFLYGKLEKELYLEQPEGFISEEFTHQVCRLKKTLYGLKQASRSWNKTFDDFLTQYRFTRSETYRCVYIIMKEDSKKIIAIWMDDGLLCGNKKAILNDIINYLS